MSKYRITMNGFGKFRIERRVWFFFWEEIRRNLTEFESLKAATDDLQKLIVSQREQREHDERCRFRKQVWP